MTILASFLVDGPLMTAPERRTATVARMARLLAEADAFAIRGDAIRHLLASGYPVSDVFILVDDARQVAMQTVVAREMSAS